MNGFDGSRAAVDAMAALQLAIKDMESGNNALRKEATSLRELVKDRESINAQRQQLVSREADKAQKMLESASETLIELRRVRLENRRLQDEYRDLHHKLQLRRDAESHKQQMTENVLSDLRHKELLESEIETLFALLLSPPEFSFDGRPNVAFNQMIASATSHSMPVTLQAVLHYLQGIPSPFRAQNLNTKREIVRAMAQARDICCKLVEELHHLETSRLAVAAKKRVQADIDSKLAQLYLLSQAMTRFSFVA
jgi:FtsZ-binding cell division protein ZapB